MGCHLKSCGSVLGFGVAAVVVLFVQHVRKQSK